MSEKTATDRKKKKVQQGSSTPDLSKEISNITAQLKSIFSFCEELKINMEQVKTNQSEIKSKLQNLEEKVLNKTINETKRDETIDNTLDTTKKIKFFQSHDRRLPAPGEFPVDQHGTKKNFF